MSEMLVATVEQRRGGSNVIKLAGILDERNELSTLVEQVGTGKVLINLAGVERINSSGTRDWVDWLARLEKKGIQPELVACSPAVVAQLNLVKNFAGKSVVKSFQVPYHCSACTRDKLLLVTIAEFGNFPPVAPECACEQCGKLMTFTDETGTYFAFVKQVQELVAAQEAAAKAVAAAAAAAAGAKADSSPDIARGSQPGVDRESAKKISQPRLPNRTSSPVLSVYQTRKSEPRISSDRISQRSLTPPPMAMPSPAPRAERSYLFVVVGLLFAVVGLLVYLLIGH
jgi:anti-anti-sigma regulatory factor